LVIITQNRLCTYTSGSKIPIDSEINASIKVAMDPGPFIHSYVIPYLALLL